MAEESLNKMYLKETIKSDKVFQPRSLIFLMYSVVKALSKRKAKGDFAERSISVWRQTASNISQR